MLLVLGVHGVDGRHVNGALLPLSPRTSRPLLHGLAVPCVAVEVDDLIERLKVVAELVGRTQQRAGADHPVRAHDLLEHELLPLVGLVVQVVELVGGQTRVLPHRPAAERNGQTGGAAVGLIRLGRLRLVAPEHPQDFLVPHVELDERDRAAVAQDGDGIVRGHDVQARDLRGHVHGGQFTELLVVGEDERPAPVGSGELVPDDLLGVVELRVPSGTLLISDVFQLVPVPRNVLQDRLQDRRDGCRDTFFGHGVGRHARPLHVGQIPHRLVGVVRQPVEELHHGLHRPAEELLVLLGVPGVSACLTTFPHLQGHRLHHLGEALGRGSVRLLDLRVHRDGACLIPLGGERELLDVPLVGEEHLLLHPLL